MSINGFYNVLMHHRRYRLDDGLRVVSKLGTYIGVRERGVIYRGGERGYYTGVGERGGCNNRTLSAVVEKNHVGR